MFDKLRETNDYERMHLDSPKLKRKTNDQNRFETSVKRNRFPPMLFSEEYQKMNDGSNMQIVIVAHASESEHSRYLDNNGRKRRQDLNIILDN